VAGCWIYPGIPVSSTNKTDHHDIAEILWKVALNNIKPTKPTNRNITFSGTPSTCYPLSFGNLIVKPVHFLLMKNIIKRGNQWIII
jgi:hypothetical protein